MKLKLLISLSSQACTLLVNTMNQVVNNTKCLGKHLLEARTQHESNAEHDEFGYDRMKKLLTQNSHYDPTMIQKVIISKLYEFCGGKDLDDDYTMLVIKFN